MRGEAWAPTSGLALSAEWIFPNSKLFSSVISFPPQHRLGGGNWGPPISAANSHSDLGSRFLALSFNFLMSEGGGYCPALTWEALREWLDPPAVKTPWAKLKSCRPQSRC